MRLHVVYIGGCQKAQGWFNHNTYKQGGSLRSPPAAHECCILALVRNPRSSGHVRTPTLTKAWPATAGLTKQAAEIALYLYSSRTFYRACTCTHTVSL